MLMKRKKEKKKKRKKKKKEKKRKKKKKKKKKEKKCREAERPRGREALKGAFRLCSRIQKKEPSFQKAMTESLFECMDVRRKMDHLNDGVVTRLALQAKRKRKRNPQRQKTALFLLPSRANCSTSAKRARDRSAPRAACSSSVPN
jgi:hypothetical protein